MTASLSLDHLLPAFEPGSKRALNNVDQVENLKDPVFVVNMHSHHVQVAFAVNNFFLFFLLLVFLGPHPQNMEVPRLGV